MNLINSIAEWISPSSQPMILDHTEVNSDDPMINLLKGFSISHKVCFCGKFELSVIKSIDYSIEELMYNNFEALRCAITSNNDLLVAVYLLRKIKHHVNLNELLLEGLPVFIYACQHNHLPAVKYLSYFCDYKKEVNHSSRREVNIKNGLSYASTHHNPELWIYLIKLGLQITKHTLTVNSKFEQTIVKHFCAMWYYKWLSIANKPPSGRLFLLDYREVSIHLYDG